MFLALHKACNLEVIALCVLATKELISNSVNGATTLGIYLDTFSKPENIDSNWIILFEDIVTWEYYKCMKLLRNNSFICGDMPMEKLHWIWFKQNPLANVCGGGGGVERP